MKRRGRSFEKLLALPLVLSAAAAPGVSRADEYVFNFGSSSQWDPKQPSGSETWRPGFWNTRDGRLQVGVSPGGVAGKELYFGLGTDGAFSDGPAQSGITVALPTITFNTDVKSTYEFTSFTLSAGNTIEVTGSRPLVIRVLGAVVVDGVIYVDGSPGENNTSGATDPGSGGSGRATGGAGGRSSTLVADAGAGSAAVPPADELDPNPTDGGDGGNRTSTAASVQGGGGGCNGTHGGGVDAGPGYGGPAAGTCAAAATIAGAFETIFVGGAGGGGGGAFTGAVPIIGGGGGAGGGAVRITALDSILVNPGAGISAKGGDGGAAQDQNTPDNTSSGAGGGGGAGGSVWFQSAGAITGGGAVDVQGGLGGQSVPFAPNFFGGDGSAGIFRVEGSDAAYAGPASTPASSTVYSQVTTGSGAEYVIYSKVIDFSTRYIYFQEPTETILTSGACGNSGTLAVRYEGSFDGTNFTKTVPKAAISELDDYPYVRVKVTIVPSTTSAAAAPCLTGLTLNYALRDLSNINLDGGLFCGRIQTKNRGSGGPPWGGIAEIALLALAWLLARLALVRRPILR